MKQWTRTIGFLAFTWAVAGCSATVQSPPETRLEPLGTHLEPLETRLEPLGAPPAAATPWTSLAANDDPRDFHFVVVSDRTGEHRDGVFHDAMAQINLLEPAFVVSVGDLIEGYTEDPETLREEWTEIEGYVGTLGQPFFYTAGNHDMSNAIMAEEWKTRFGPSYYAFSYKDVLFITLNSELFGMVHDRSKPVPGPFDPQEQMAWLGKTLDDNPSPRWTIVLIHQPLWDSPRVHPDWERVEKMLSTRPHTVFAGHMHRYIEHRRNDQSYITLATTGGGSDLRGPTYGEFDQVALVTMTQKGPVIANLDLDGIYPVDIITPKDRELVQALEKSIQPVAVSHTGETFRQGEALFAFRNPTKKTVTVEIMPEPGPMMHTTPVSMRQEIGAGESQTFRIQLGAREETSYESLESGDIHFRIKTEGSDNEPVVLDVEHILLPEKKLPITQRQDPVEIDGDLGEWSALPIESAGFAEIDHPEHHQGPADASLRFAVEQDEKNLYVAVEVTDDILVSSSEKIAREQDGVSLQLDARPNPARDTNKGLWASVRSGEFRQIALITATLVPPAEDHVMKRFTGGGASPWTYAIRRQTNGYTIEFALPLSYLEAQQGADWQEVRINLGLQDTDHGEKPVSLWWRPSRFGAKAVPGSGTFLR